MVGWIPIFFSDQPTMIHLETGGGRSVQRVETNCSASLLVIS
jgi:hypothetical protein